MRDKRQYFDELRGSKKKKETHNNPPKSEPLGRSVGGGSGGDSGGSGSSGSNSGSGSGGVSVSGRMLK